MTQVLIGDAQKKQRWEATFRMPGQQARWCMLIYLNEHAKKASIATVVVAIAELVKVVVIVATVIAAPSC